MQNIWGSLSQQELSRNIHAPNTIYTSANYQTGVIMEKNIDRKTGRVHTRKIQIYCNAQLLPDINTHRVPWNYIRRGKIGNWVKENYKPGMFNKRNVLKRKSEEPVQSGA